MPKNKVIVLCIVLSTGASLFLVYSSIIGRIRAYISDPVSFHYVMTPLAYFVIGIFVTSGLRISYRAIIHRDESDKKIFQQAGYLDSSNPKYSAKLAAAVQAWTIISEKEDLKSSPKQCIEKFLTENAELYGLSKEGISQCSQVANWDTKGGAPKTPG